MTCRFSIVPFLEIVACSTTVPDSCGFGDGGVLGHFAADAFPCMTPEETVIFLGAAA